MLSGTAAAQAEQPHDAVDPGRRHARSLGGIHVVLVASTATHVRLAQHAFVNRVAVPQFPIDQTTAATRAAAQQNPLQVEPADFLQTVSQDRHSGGVRLNAGDER